VFQEVTWNRRSELLKGRLGSDKKKSNEIFETYRACVLTVLTLRNAREWPTVTLKELLDLNLNELTESTFGDIRVFPPRVFLAQSSAQRLGSILKRWCILKAGALGNLTVLILTLAGNRSPAHWFGSAR
jgi:hypothetical protein